MSSASFGRPQAGVCCFWGDAAVVHIPIDHNSPFA